MLAKQQDMNRKIKFRALKDDMSNFGFVYGNLIYDTEDNPRIQDGYSMLFHTCIKGTEGQFLFTDVKYGDFWQGDLVNLPSYLTNGKDRLAEIVWKDNGAIVLKALDNGTEYGRGHLYSKAIGNIHETKQP